MKYTISDILYLLRKTAPETVPGLYSVMAVVFTGDNSACDQVEAVSSALLGLDFLKMYRDRVLFCRSETNL